MCGIAGLWRWDSGPIDTFLLERMAAALAHRGPDGQRLHTEPGMGLAHRRLSIIDIAGGSQPMLNEDGSVVVVANCEIYNFAELTAELAARGHVFATRCDTETIVHGWEEWGEAVTDHLDGMFALAVWDRRRRTLFLARDRLGKKPLFVARLPNGVAFASEIAALAQLPGVDRRINPAALEDYLALGYVPDPGTIFAGVSKLAPAHRLTLGPSAPADDLPAGVRYWRAGPVAHVHDPREAAGLLRDELRRATAARLVADVPLGAFLSGGVDSASVVAAAARGGAAPLSTFTIGFPGAQDESGPAAAIARHVGASHTVERADAIDWVEAASRQGRVFGEPFGDSSAVPTAQVCALARRHVTVALSGDGGDEVFAGYRRHRWHMLVEAGRRHLPPRLRGPVSALARLYPKLDRAPRFLRAKHTLTELGLTSALGYYRTMARTSDERRRGLLHPAMTSSLHGYDPSDRFVRLMDAADGGDALAQAQQVDIETWLPGQMLTKVDRTSMASGLEVRSPLLDPRLVAFGLGLPASLKVKGGRGKAVLREAVAPWLPADILARPKQGFAMPLGGTLRRDMARVRTALCAPSLMDQRLLRPEAVGRLLDEHESGRFDHAQPIWLLLVLAGFVASERPI